MLDSSLGDQGDLATTEEVKRCINVGLLSVQESAFIGLPCLMLFPCLIRVVVLLFSLHSSPQCNIILDDPVLVIIKMVF